MKNKIEDLRDHLFETIERLKSGDMELKTAKAISEAAQIIINSGKVEVDFIKATKRNQATGFMDVTTRTDLPRPDGTLPAKSSKDYL